jgi:proline dehydrogenase
MRQRGFASSICPWDDIGTPADEVASSYRAAQRQLTAENLDCYLSIKAPSIGYQRSLLLAILESGNVGMRLHFDSLDLETAEPTFTLIDSLLPQFPNLSCTLPGRWRRSVADVDWAVRRNLAVRVVKGQWPDPKDPDIDVTKGFLQVIDALAGHAPYVAVATHDPQLAEAALLRLRASGTTAELELLFGLPVDAAARIARLLDVPVRLYIPYGYGWLPYSLSQARRHPRLLLWMLHDFIGRRSNGIYS